MFRLGRSRGSIGFSLVMLATGVIFSVWWLGSAVSAKDSTKGEPHVLGELLGHFVYVGMVMLWLIGLVLFVLFWSLGVHYLAGRDLKRDRRRNSAATPSLVPTDGIVARPCPEWPTLMKIAPNLEFKHYTLADVLPGAATALSEAPEVPLGDLPVCGDLDQRVFFARHTNPSVIDLLRDSHWVDLTRS
jgi:hypothetical protein